jgi:hypothetical protein
MGIWWLMSNLELLEKIWKIDYRQEAILQDTNLIHMNFPGTSLTHFHLI